MHEKKIAGVCAGFARYLDVDPTLMRIIWLVVALTTGVGFIAYIIAWIAMPRDEQVTCVPVPQRT
jgi:phage shock protein PspC (stress-responsive transcriptional regulator)